MWPWSDGLLHAPQVAQAVEERQGVKFAYLGEIAWQNGWIDRAQVETAASSMGKSAYGEYLRSLLR